MAKPVEHKNRPRRFRRERSCGSYGGFGRASRILLLPLISFMTFDPLCFGAHGRRPPGG